MKKSNNRVEVILLSRVRRLGVHGDIATVARGFFRNYLEPQGLATRFSEEAKAEIQKSSGKYSSKESNESLEELEGKVIFFERQASTSGTLFGSVTSKDVSDEIKNQLNILVDKKHIIIDKKIRNTGIHKILIDSSKTLSINLCVGKSIAEAKEIWQEFLNPKTSTNQAQKQEKKVINKPEKKSAQIEDKKNE